MKWYMAYAFLFCDKNIFAIHLYVRSICSVFESFPVHTELSVQLGFSIQWIVYSKDLTSFEDPPVPQLGKFWFSSYGPKSCQPIRLQDSLKCNISRKKWIIKFIFGMQINIEVFYKLILSTWICVTRDAQSTQNKFAYLCNISRKAWGMKWIFLLQINMKVFYK